MKKGKTVAAAAVTAAAVACMVTGAAFETPAELLPELAVLEEQQMEDDTASTAEERQKGPMAKIRAWMLGLPTAVRMLVAVPLWCVGWVLWSALSVLWMGAAPWVARLTGWACLALVLLAVFAFSVKSAFPAVSFRRILRLRNVLSLVLMSTMLCLADMALPSVWEGYNAVSRTVWRVGATCLLAILCLAELKHQGRREVKRQAVPHASERTEVELEARRLADSVCGK